MRIAVLCLALVVSLGSAEAAGPKTPTLSSKPKKSKMKHGKLPKPSRKKTRSRAN